MLDDLFRMTDVHFNLLCETEQSPLHEIPKERKILENLFV